MTHWLAIKTFSTFTLGLVLTQTNNVTLPPITHTPKDYCPYNHSLAEYPVEVINSKTIDNQWLSGGEGVGMVITPTPTAINPIQDEPSQPPATEGSGEDNAADRTTPQPTPTVTTAPILTENPKPNDAPVETQVTNLSQAVNEYREARGLSALQNPNDVCQVTRQRADQVAVHFSHDGFEGAVQQLSFEQAGENIWQGTEVKIENIVDSWDKSPTHQQNMLGNWTRGCGIINKDAAVFIFVR